MQKIVIPKEITKPSWAPNYMLGDVNQNPGPGKVFGVTAYNYDATLQRHLDCGVTHIQDLVQPNIDFNLQWVNYRGPGGGGVDSPTAFVNQFGANRLSKLHGYGAQLAEDGLSRDAAIEAMGRLYDQMVAADPSIQHPADTNIIGDYWTDLPGGSFTKAGSDSVILQRHRDNTLNQTACQLNFRDDSNGFPLTWYDNDGNQHSNRNAFYQSPWGFGKQNALIPRSYINTWVPIRQGIYYYEHLFNLKKSRGGLAGPTKHKLVGYMWSSYDDSGWKTIRNKVNIPINNPEGVISLTSQWHPIPHNIMRYQAFMDLLIGDGLYLWEVGGQYCNDPIRLDTVRLHQPWRKYPMEAQRRRRSCLYSQQPRASAVPGHQRQPHIPGL